MKSLRYYAEEILLGMSIFVMATLAFIALNRPVTTYPTPNTSNSLLSSSGKSSSSSLPFTTSAGVAAGSR